MVLRLALALCVLFMTAQASYAQSFDQNVYYRIVSRLSNKCIDVRDFSVNNGGKLQQWDCAAAVQSNQLWNIVSAGGGTFRIVSASNALCADVENASTANGAKMQQYACNLAWNQTNQVFTTAAGAVANYYSIRPVSGSGGKCLDVEGVSTANGANIQQWDCTFGQSNQEWWFQPYIARTPLTNLQTFGYYLWSADPADLNNLRTHGNIAQVTAISQLATLGAGVKGMFPLDFWVPKAKVGGDIYSDGPNDGGLRRDYVAYWNSIKGSINPNQVGLFYVLDEPYWNFDGKGFSDAEIYQMLDLVASLIRTDATFNAVPIGVVEAWPKVPKTYPPSIDWVGFDYYGSDTTYYLSLLSALKANLQPNQKIILVPRGHVYRDPDPGSSATTTAEQNEVVGQAEFYLHTALAEPRTVGMLVFTGDTASLYIGPPDPNPRWTRWIGTFDMSSVWTKWQFQMRALGFGTP